MKLAQIMERYQDQLPPESLLPSQQKALWAILHCRTPVLGEIFSFCPQCRETHLFFQSCGHRNCPQCQNQTTTQWLERQRDKLLPVDYFLFTFTLPAQLRNLVWQHQRNLYQLLFQSAEEALKELASNPKHLGGEMGFTGVLHTHSRKLDFHPHLHFVIPAGALRDDRQLWFQKSTKFLLPEKPLAQLFRGKFLAGLKALGLPFSTVLYQTAWVIHAQAAGRGEKAFEYLSKYLYRGVISESQIISDQQGQITFTYTESETGEKKTRTLPGAQFLRLLLQHVLPQGFRRVRDYGFLHGNARQTLNKLKLILQIKVRLPAKPLKFKNLCRRCQIPLTWFFPARRERAFPQRAAPAF